MNRAHALLALLPLLATTAVATEHHAWSRYRGPAAEGASVEGVLPDDLFGLRPAWAADLGSGYSGISVADGRVVTMFNAGEVDVAAAFDLATGRELWRYELGEKYSGHTGSSDGPLSTPAIADGTVYLLGPHGRLAALSLDDGSEIWARQLDEETSTKPFYGYTSSPVPMGDRLLVATGGEGRAVTAYDRADGTPLWTAGDDSVSYQTPSLVRLGEGSQLVVVSNQRIQGIDPESGEVLWSHRHTEGERQEETAQVVVVDERRFVVDFDQGAVMYRLTGDGVEEVWRSRAFANSLSVPVVVGDHLYGYSGTFLTCAEVETGEIVWRTRASQGVGLAEIDGRLAIFARGGDLVLVEPSPEGYREITRIAALEAGDHVTAAPSYAEGLFLVRDFEKMAAVRVDAAAEPQVAAVDPAERLKGELGEWVAAVEALPEGERQAAVGERFGGDATTPIVEEGGWAHFLWRGEAADVGMSGDFLGPGEELGLYRVAGTDLFFRSLELDPAAQYTYAFSVDFGPPTPDPSNPHTVDNGFAVFSDLLMPGYPEQPHVAEPAADTARGELDTFPFRSEILGNTRTLQVWRPPAWGRDPEARFPLLVVNHGDNLLRGSLMRNTLDNLVGRTVAPLVAVFVPRVAPPEYGGPQVDDYVRFLAEELLPHMERHYRTDPERRAIMGPGSAGVTAVYAAVKHPDVFQRAAVQSFYPIEPAHGSLPAMIAADGEKPELVQVVWSAHDYDFDPARRADEASEALVGWLREGGIETRVLNARYSPGWAGWRGQHDEILAGLFPLVEEASAGDRPASAR